ncbi:unnamed protein product [Anisakis simplex]|uniref:BPI1 domain-containing protein n=1 Tax=Anisakis simplex TaxID=6269 RepID=A0A0M3JSW9_ANISI|nr:unnamed protein product [Anisakis simplex]
MHDRCFICGKLYNINLRISLYIDEFISSSSSSNNSSLSYAPFNPSLNGGDRRYPGVKVRFNHRAFKYATSLFGTIVNSEIQRARIPAFTHCTPQVNGCVTVYNLFVSRYRCPQRVIVYPAPPNRFIITVQNLDIGVTGNIGGQIEILLPIGLSGIAHTNAHQVSVTLQTVLERSQNGASQIRVVGCTAQVGYVDAFIENGGIIGDIINTQFRAKISRQVQSVLPKKICESLPKIIMDRINPRLHQIPQSIPLTQITSLANGFIGRIKKPLPQRVNFNFTFHLSTLLLSVLLLDATCLQRQCQKQSSNRSKKSQQTDNSASSNRSGTKFQGSVRQAVQITVIPIQCMQSKMLSNFLTCFSFQNKLSGISLNSQFHGAYATPNDYTIELNGEFYGNGQGHAPFYAFPMYPPLPSPNNPMVDALLSDFTINSLAYQLQKYVSRGFISFKVGPETPKVGALLKTTCSDDEYDDTSVEFLSYRNLMNSEEIVSLFVLQLDEESEDDFDGTEAIASEVDSDVAASMNVSTRHIRKRQANNNDEKIESIEEFETESTGGLADLGICIGDIMPAIREAHPNKNLTIQVHTAQAPSVIFASKNGGTATIDLLADAEIYLDDETREKVGTIQVRTVIECTIRSSGNRVAGTAQLKVLKLKDPGGTLGLSQDTFDNLASLAKGFISKMANDALKDGFSVDLPTSTLPISILRPHLRIVDHAILLSADLFIKPSLLDLDSAIDSNAICRTYN